MIIFVGEIFIFEIKIDLGVADIIEIATDTETGNQVDKMEALLIRSIRAALSPLEKWVLQKEFNLKETKKLHQNIYWCFW